MKKMTKNYLLMFVVWLSLTSMTTLNSCGTCANKTIVDNSTHIEKSPATVTQTSGEVVMGAARTGEYVHL